MNTAHIIDNVRKQQIKSEIRHLTQPLWRMAIIVVCLIVSTGAILRIVHTAAKSEVQRADDSR